MKFPKEINNIQEFAQGSRSIVYIGKLNSIKIAIKVQKKEIGAEAPLKNEAKFLKILNKHKIGPKLLKSGKNYIVYKFVKGTPLPEYLKIKKDKKMLISVLKQCRTLDKLKINKLEFTRPLKHVLIDKKPVMIDFEKCYYTDSPKNVTQFCQYLFKSNQIKTTKSEFIKTLKKYKNSQTDKNFKNIILLIK